MTEVAQNGSAPLAGTAEGQESYCETTLERAEGFYTRGDRTQARALLESIVATNLEPDAASEIRAKEQAIYRLGELFLMQNDGTALMQLLKDVRPFFNLLPKAKTTKMVRRLFEWIVQSGVPLSVQHTLCVETIQWARAERRTFLRHRLQLRLVEVLFEMRDMRGALATLIALLREVRRLDDRTLLLDIHLLESKIYYAIRNGSKARAALVSARTTANSIYCPPLAQAEIDLQSGVLHAEEHDAKTAYSYLYEAFEGFHQLGDQAKLARRALRYMILAKIATDNADELAAVLSSKNVLEYQGPDLVALRGIANAYAKQDVHLFNDVLAKQRELGEAGILHDEFIRRQLEEMYDTLTERHLLKVIEPYNRVQLAYLAGLLRLDEQTVEGRVSQLILDGKLRGIVDQQHRCLIIFDEVERSRTRKQTNVGATNTGNNNNGTHAHTSSSSLNSTAGKGGNKTSTENTSTTVKDEADEDAGPNVDDLTTLHQDALTALESYDALVTALFDKVAGKFDALIEETIAKRKGANGTKGKTSTNAGGKDNNNNNNESGKGKNGLKKPGEDKSNTGSGEKKDSHDSGSNDTKGPTTSSSSSGNNHGAGEGGKKKQSAMNTEIRRKEEEEECKVQEEHEGEEVEEEIEGVRDEGGEMKVSMTA